MQITDHNVAPAFDLAPFVSKLTLTAAERKTIDGAVAEITRIERLKLPFVRDGRRATKDAAWEVGQNPTEATVEKLVEAATRENVAQDILHRLKSALSGPVNAQIDKLSPIACRCIDEVANAVRTTAAAHREAADKLPFGSDMDGNEVERRLAKTIDTLEGDKGRCIREHASLEILQAWGLAEDPFTLI